MSLNDDLRNALFGNPPSTGFQPSREGLLAAFEQLDKKVTGAVAGIIYYATGTERAADVAKPIGTIGKAANETDYYRREGTGWVVDNSIYEGVAGVVQPLIDEATDARDEAIEHTNEVGIRPNQNPYGRTLREMNQYNTPQFDAIVDAGLNAQGFYTSVRDVSGGKQSFVGASIVKPFVEGTRGFWRFGVIAGAAGDFGSPRLYLFSGDTLLGSTLAVLETTVSSTIRWYTVAPENVPATVTTYLVGTQEWTGGAGAEARVFGVQHHLSSSVAYGIPPTDYPEPSSESVKLENMNLPPRLFLTEGTPPLPLYMENAFASRTPGLRTTVSSVISGQPVVQQTDDVAQIDAAQVGTSLGVIVSRPSQVGNLRWYAGAEGGPGEIAVEKAPYASTASPRVLMIGDSKTNRFMGFLLRDMLIARSMTSTFVGTIAQQTGGDPCLGEGREGKLWVQVAGIGGGLNTVSIGREADYLALSPGDKMNWNPFINPSNNQFDFPLYVDRFLGGVPPTHVIIGLGTNDVTFTINAGTWRDGAWLTGVAQALDVMVDSIKVESANINIGLWQDTTARMYSNLRWQLHSQIIRECLRYVNNPYDPRVAVIPGYLHESPETGWPTTADFVDVSTHLARGTLADDVHIDGVNRLMAARCMSDWIGCTV